MREIRERELDLAESVERDQRKMERGKREIERGRERG